MASQSNDPIEATNDGMLALSLANANNTTLYTSSLINTHIRLLKILPDNDASAPIRCTLDQHGLSEDVSYEALSYVWGDLSLPRVPITCNNQTVDVTPNLLHALFRLRQSQASRLVWIDALCINQADDVEKSHQVPLMTKIYSAAQCVIIWFGEVDDEEEAATVVSSIREVSEYCRSVMVQSENSWKSVVGAHEFWKKRIELPAEVMSRIPWQLLKTTFDNTWFKRMWCYQEAQLGKSIVVHWGSHSLDWMHIGITSLWVLGSMGSSKILPNDIDLRRSFSQAHCMFTRPNFGAPDILFDSLTIRRRFLEAAHPRDMVYGLLGLLTPHMHRSINVDYSKSTSTVFTDAAILCLERSGLSILGAVGHPADFDGYLEFASWVPQWHIPIRGFDGDYLEKYKASNGVREVLAKFPTIEDPKLRVTGLLYSTVDAISLQGGHKQINHVLMKEWYRNHTFPGDVNTLLLRAITLTMTRGFVTGQPRENEWSANKDQKKSYLEDSMAWLNHSGFMLPDPTQGLDGSKASDKIGNWERFEEIVNAACKAGCFFRTEDNTYGNGPDCMKVGDIVAVIFGHGAPFALRPVGDEFLFLGFVYVHELMNGQLMKDYVFRKIKRMEFCII
jgi:hypothetical protein